MLKNQSGKQGEDVACHYLRRRGFVIVCRNFRVRGGEIDIVCRRRGIIHFVEVKTRKSLFAGFPEEAVTPLKLRRLQSAIDAYLLLHNEQCPWQLDVISVELDDKNAVIKHYKNIGL